jgi:hypothetical protein
MDSNIIGGQNTYIGGIGYGVQADKKATVKPQEEYVTEWQQPTGDLYDVKIPLEKAPVKAKEEIVTDGQMPAVTKTPEKPAATESRVPTTLTMDMGDADACLMTSVEVAYELKNSDGSTTTVIESQLADPSTAFYKIGMNTISSVARDGIFNVDGESLAKPSGGGGA